MRAPLTCSLTLAIGSLAACLQAQEIEWRSAGGTAPAATNRPLAAASLGRPVISAPPSSAPAGAAPAARLGMPRVGVSPKSPAPPPPLLDHRVVAASCNAVAAPTPGTVRGQNPETPKPMPKGPEPLPVPRMIAEPEARADAGPTLVWPPAEGEVDLECPNCVEGPTMPMSPHECECEGDCGPGGCYCGPVETCCEEGGGCGWFSGGSSGWFGGGNGGNGGKDSGFYFGGGVYVLQPYIENNTAFFTTSGGMEAVGTVGTEFDWNHGVSPFAYIGYGFGNGIGFRGRYFNFDQSSSELTVGNTGQLFIQANPSLPLVLTSPGVLLLDGRGTDQLTFQSGLEINTIDLEMTDNLELGKWGLLLSVGGRYMQSKQRYQASLMNMGGGGTDLFESQKLLFQHQFHGGGPTLAMQARFRLGESGFALYGNARGSLLVGGVTLDGYHTGNVNDPMNLVGGNSSFSQSFNSEQDELVPVSELELGMEYGRPIKKCYLFGTLAIVNQTYFGLGTASNTTGNVSLFGLQASLGLKF